MSTILAVILFGGAFVWVVSLFYKDARINKHGVVLDAKIENIKAVSSNENGSTNVVYTLSVSKDGEERLVKGKNTIPTFYSSQLQPGETIKIKYLDDKNIEFIFRE